MTTQVPGAVGEPVGRQHPTPTKPGWYWVELSSECRFVVQVGYWGREPHRLTFEDPTESKIILHGMHSPLVRSWGPRVPDWNPRIEVPQPPVAALEDAP
jgi:hypothetical protein